MNDILFGFGGAVIIIILGSIGLALLAYKYRA